MMTDERITRSRKDIAAQALKICLVLLLAAALYRQLVLGQHPREFWDILLVFFIGGAYFNFMSVARGNTQDDHGSSLPRALPRVIRIVVVVLVVGLVSGRVASTTDFAGQLSVGLATAVPFVLLIYFLDRRWRRRSGLGETEEDLDS